MLNILIYFYWCKYTQYSITQYLKAFFLFSFNNLIKFPHIFDTYKIKKSNYFLLEEQGRFMAW